MLSLTAGQPLSTTVGLLLTTTHSRRPQESMSRELDHKAQHDWLKHAVAPMGTASMGQWRWLLGLVRAAMLCH